MQKTVIFSILCAFVFLIGGAKAAAQPDYSELTRESLIAGQPGKAAFDAMDKQGERALADTKRVVAELKKNGQYKHMLKKLNPSEFDEAAAILMAVYAKNSLTEAVKQVAEDSRYQTRSVVRSAMLLFPLDRYALYRQLAQQQAFDSKKLTKWAASTGVLTKPLYPDSMTRDTIFVQPLIESASVTVQHLPKEAEVSVKFRIAGDNAANSSNTWQAARSLVYEPVTGVHTGPLVYLSAATRYELQLTIDLPDKQQNQFKKIFTTKADTPPINPDKVYHLSDIYQGGTLDLEALGIEGDKNGWVKIVGDPDTIIRADDPEKHAINIGDNSYIYFENITVRGGRTHSIYANKAHHIWINQCDIANWGRAPNVMKNGVAFELEDAAPINYDSAIYLRQSGVITIENCTIHDPRPMANDWRSGHPKGPNAFFAHANHPDPQYKGQVIIRNNTFTGKPEHRFNDVIEGRKNASALGGFVRDSAIYDNTLAYSNDDGIEIDGGQYNVLVYNNDISHTYTGVSAIPTRVGPSFVFNNYIHDLGDTTGKQWAAIKLGGLLTGAFGKSYLFHNLIAVNRNGFTASRFQQDSTLLTHAQNNVVITKHDNNAVGYNLLDQEDFDGSTFVNNYLINLKRAEPKVMGSITIPYAFAELVNVEKARQILSNGQQTRLPVAPAFHINNFSQLTADGEDFIYGIVQ
ncbi:right-handed parallel beta-helix repeat-containing protein [Alteromonas lipotrueiana]|uniref:right-handed parallel beta-helix repeat-containing protein n=1 Tax=Alteromonas lipotrueiana TaxID=2803815 RepID=UPI001C47C766|nr:right-handed parallel beta-helix repeat-containing protein [Alteromonas lipotrueiana]